MDLYEILELQPNASKVDIKKAYIRLAKIYHPDKNNDSDALDKFQKIQTAYDILMNDNSRQEYQKLNKTDKNNLVEIIEKIIKDNLDINQLKKYGIKLDKADINYLQSNFFNYFHDINITDLLDLFKKGAVYKKDFNNVINCSESDINTFDEYSCSYYYNIPLFLTSLNKNDINMNFNININDIIIKNKKNIIIKRKKEDNTFIKTEFTFNLDKPYIVFFGGGDCDKNNNYGNLIIKLNLSNNLYWDDKLILVEENITLYEMIYGLDISLDIGTKTPININNWVPSRDGLYINISSLKNINLPKELNHEITIKLSIIYEHTSEKEEILKKYFS
jgi:curved DNA-binding protein CbpA